MTTDKSIQHQQNLGAYRIGFVLLRPRSNDFVDIEPLVPRLLERLRDVTPGKLLVVE